MSSLPSLDFHIAGDGDITQNVMWKLTFQYFGSLRVLNSECFVFKVTFFTFFRSWDLVEFLEGVSIGFLVDLIAYDF